MIKLNLQDGNQRRLVFGVVIILFVAVFVSMNMASKNESINKPNVLRSMPGIGLLPELKTAMLKDRELRVRVSVLVDFDEYYIFSNYKEINARVAEIMFLWAGLTVADLETMNSDRAIEFFLRRSHGLSDDRSIEGNPYLGENPWPRLFNNVKSRLLMLGGGRNIYDGVAYYDAKDDNFVIAGGLSKTFLKEFSKFLKTREDAKGFRNNLFVFIDDTRGLRNLSDQDKALIRGL